MGQNRLIKVGAMTFMIHCAVLLSLLLNNKSIETPNRRFENADVDHLTLQIGSTVIHRCSLMFVTILSNFLKITKKKPFAGDTGGTGRI